MMTDEDLFKRGESLKEIKLKSQKFGAKNRELKEQRIKTENQEFNIKEVEELKCNLPRQVLKDTIISQDISNNKLYSAKECEEGIESVLEVCINSLKRILDGDFEMPESDNKEKILKKLIEEYEGRYNMIKEKLLRAEEQVLIYREQSKNRDSELLTENKILITNFTGLQKEYMELKVSLVNQSRVFNESMQEISSLNKKIHELEQNSNGLEESNTLLLNRIQEIEAENKYYHENYSQKKPRSKTANSIPSSPSISHNP